MSLQLTIRNRQRARAADLRLLRNVVNGLFRELPHVGTADLGIFLVAAPEMTRLNETFLRHAGSTDVLAFDYTTQPTPGPSQEGKSASRAFFSSPPGRGRGWVLHGEIFLCVDEAILQARRFRTTWQAELVRYLIHGVLHLLGHDDRRAAPRRRMKHAEDRLLKSVSARFALSRLARKPKLRQ